MKNIWEAESGWRLVEKEIELPDGRKFVRVAVDHPGAVVLLPVDGDRILLIKQFRYSINQFILELPAGTRSWEEDWGATAQRELREETGYRAEKIDWLVDMWAAPGLSNELLKYYVAQELSLDPLIKDEDEYIEAIWYPLTQVVEMVLSGEIEDAKTVAGIMHFWVKQQKIS